MKFGNLELSDWVQDMVGNWYRCTNLIKPTIFNYPSDKDIFVEVWTINYKCFLPAPWFKEEYLSKIYSEQFYLLKFTNSNTELVKDHVDDFLNKIARLASFA